MTPTDNAMAESFFSTLEAELLAAAGSRPRPKPGWPASATSRAGTIRRLHSGLGYRSPVTYEADMQAAEPNRNQQARKPSTRTGQPQNRGPVTAHTTTTKQAIANLYGFPRCNPVAWANLENQASISMAGATRRTLRLTASPQIIERKPAWISPTPDHRGEGGSSTPMPR